MGTAPTWKQKRARIYKALIRRREKLADIGIETTYKNLELQGRGFVIYFATVDPDSAFAGYYEVLRFNATSQPDAARKRKDDADYTDFNSLDSFEDGIERVKAHLNI